MVYNGPIVAVQTYSTRSSWPGKPPFSHFFDGYHTKMIATLLGTLFLIALFWTLIRLRDLRERELEDELPGDKITVILGVFLLLSKACLHYHRDRGHYPSQVSGASDALVETGYLADDPLAKMTKIMHLFSIVATESSGSAVCLTNTTAALASEMVRRVEETGGTFLFFDLRGAQFIPVTSTIPHETVNLSLMLPETPMELPEPEGVV